VINSRIPGFSRRTALLGGLGTALAACTATPSPSPLSPSPSRPESDGAERDLSALEASFGGRVGVFALDTGSGRTVEHRAGEPFLMCSTYKALAVSAILGARRPLDQVVHYDRAEVISHSPVTGQHVDDGMPVSALCQAAIEQSDNTAANVLLRILGGPPAVTAFTRTLGDQVTRLDRAEPEVNIASGPLDTSTPARLAADLRALVLGDVLDPASRDLLTGWLKGNTTGANSIRAGLPPDWQVGDKTGSGNQGEVNDLAVVWPPNRAPWVIAVYTAPTDPKTTEGYQTVASAARIAANALSVVTR
jgi:beta-lactamase class A